MAEGDIDFQDLAAGPVTPTPQTSVSDAVDQFQVENQELALVFEDGDVIGMVTVTDSFASTTGGIQDPLDIS
ncbi:MAG: CBS domain-containing protein [Halolamina sp.]